MNEQQLIKTCKEIINSLDWYESDLFENGDFEKCLNKELKTDNLKYDVVLINESNWEDTGYGKYYSRDITYQLVQYDSQIQSYPTELSVSKEFNIYFDLPVTKSGSYFTEWYYEYEKPTMMQKRIIHIPEKIIPAHDEERMETI